jgi:surface polysaccharide O-acyltransferase-like enzyme
MGKSKRNYGIDLLRIISMFLIVVLHILSHGGALAATKTGIGYSIGWLFEFFGVPALNCFILISGYVGYKEERYFPKVKNILSLYCVVWFFSVTISVIAKLLLPSMVSTSGVLQSFFPVITNRYWFFTAYVGMFVLSPLLNYFVHKASKKVLMLTLLIIVFFGTVSLFLDPFGFGDGYSFLWLSCVYTVGAIMKKCDLVNGCSLRTAALLIVSGLLISWLPKVLFGAIPWSFLPLSLEPLSGFFMNHCSPFMMMMSVGWLVIFSKMGIGDGWKSVIGFFSVSAFSVYIIHEHPFLRWYLVSEKFAFLGNYNVIVMLLLAMLIGLAIFLICILLDKIRMLLFRLLRIDSLIDKLGNQTEGLIHKTVSRMAE